MDIHHQSRHGRSRSRHRPVLADDDYLVVPSQNFLRVRSQSQTRPRARSVGNYPSEVRQEAAYITGRVEARGRMGEAHHGATRDWTIVDVPPGTKRLRMDGVGGGAAEVTWQRYNGVRRARFIPNAEPTADSRIVNGPGGRDSRDRLSVQIYDRNRQIEVEKIKDRRARPPMPQQDVWTEITRDLVSRHALERRGYPYEATEYFFYVMEYLSQVCIPFLSLLRKNCSRAIHRSKSTISLTSPNVFAAAVPSTLIAISKTTCTSDDTATGITLLVTLVSRVSVWLNANVKLSSTASDLSITRNQLKKKECDG